MFKVPFSPNHCCWFLDPLFALRGPLFICFYRKDFRPWLKLNLRNSPWASVLERHWFPPERDRFALLWGGPSSESPVGLLGH